MDHVYISRYPAPPHTSSINTYKPFSTTVDNEYELALYERTVKVCIDDNMYLLTGKMLALCNLMGMRFLIKG